MDARLVSIWRMRAVRCALIALLQASACCDDPCRGPTASDAWVVGHASAVAEAERFARAADLETHVESPPDASALVVFAVSGLDGPMLPVNVSLDELPVPESGRAVLLLVYSALVPDADTAELVISEWVTFLENHGQSGAASYLRLKDDAYGADMIAALARE